MSNDPDTIKIHKCPNLPKDEDAHRFKISVVKDSLPQYWSIYDEWEYNCGVYPISFCPFCGVKLE